MAEPEEMYQCQTTNCGYIYNPDKGERKGKIKKGTPFNDIPDEWRCPVCGGTKKSFRPLAGPGSVYEDNLKTRAAASSKSETGLKKFKCDICGHIYDPALGDDTAGIGAGTYFDDLPDDWKCSICGAGKDEFTEM